MKIKIEQNNTLGKQEKKKKENFFPSFSFKSRQKEKRENDRKRMLGHSFGGDVTNAVYGHRTLEELRTEIEKIKVPFVTNCDYRNPF